jgi:hypothetical protein
MKTSHAPNRMARPREWKALAKLAKCEPRQDTPVSLPREDIRQMPSVLQPRFDSIAYAPGRSEGHIAELARIAKGGVELDPVTIVAFGNGWYLVDGHHRLAAYEAAGWERPIPVRVLQSDIRGEDRVHWAVHQSVVDNKKSRLNMSNGDKLDNAWLSVATGSSMSKAETARTFGVSDSTVASMRKAKADLEEAGGDPQRMFGWRMAQTELRRLAGDDAGRGGSDFRERQRREAAKRLKGIMEMRLAPRELADALEAYSPGLVEAMALARSAAQDDDENDDLMMDVD